MELSPTSAESRRSDVELARQFVVDIGRHCWGGKTDMVDRVYDAIAARFPRSGWTRRRVRSIWHRECAGIQFHEMRQLADVAHAIELEQAQIQEARREHREAINKTARIAAFLERQDADFHRPHIEALRGVAG